MKPLIIMVGLLVLCASPGAVAETTFRVTVPDGTPPDAKVYIAGDFQSWQPGNPEYQLEKAGASLWRITLPLAEGQPLQFKFTLGSWCFPSATSAPLLPALGVGEGVCFFSPN